MRTFTQSSCADNRSRPDGVARLDLRGIPPHPFCPHPDLFNGFSWQKYAVQRVEFDKCPTSGGKSL
jgi:hypothetical protein